MCTPGQKCEEYPAPNWLYGSRSLDLRCSWLLKGLPDKTMGCTRSKGKLFSTLSTWVRGHAYVTLLPGQKSVSTEAGLDHWLPGSQDFSAWTSLSLLRFLFFFSWLWFSTWPGHLHEVVLHRGDSTGWLLLPGLCSGVCWLPAECLQWNDLTQQGLLNRVLRFSCKINPKTSSYVDKL